jgi:hypothetical protein
LALFAIMPLTFRESLVLGILSHAADIAPYVLREDMSYAALVYANGLTIIWLFYLPVLIMLLRRPNVSAICLNTGRQRA